MSNLDGSPLSWTAEDEMNSQEIKSLNLQLAEKDKKLRIAVDTLKKLSQDQLLLNELNENALRSVILMDIHDAREALKNMGESL